MRLIFLNRFYWPEEPATAQLLTDLAEALAARGHDVTIITSHPDIENVPRREARRGVSIVRIRSIRSARSGAAGKAIEWLSFLIAVTWRLRREVKGGATIIAMTDPPLLAIPAWLAAKLRGARLFHWVQDIYPELAIELAGQRWLAAVRPLRNAAWRGADGCITLGADMADVIAASGVARRKISVVPNWAPAGLAPVSAGAAATLRATSGLGAKFVVAYSGNLGRVHDLEPVLALADALRDDGRFVFLFIGGGARRDALQATAAQRKLANVHFRPAQPRARLAESLAVGDVHLVTLLPGCERYVFPSKLYGVVAIGRPVVFIGPRGCELARLVVENDLGVAFERTETAALAEALRTLQGDPARRARHAAATAAFARKAGGVAMAAAHWEALLGPPGAG